ncbi:MAG: metallophosphoesterase family protein [Lachnospiraceae bacterium]|nr:metallophosphoesterase family protein [Lachnospiraceae bacterium]
MHRIGIISDTHGLLRPEVVQALQGCEAILHGGDINSAKILDEVKKIAPTYVVRGNNDKEWASELPETVSPKLYGLRFFMVHNKRFIPQDLADIDIVVYGHSHKYEEKYVDGTLLLNPGSCGPRRFTQPITFAVLEVEEDCSFQVRKVEIAHTKKSEGITDGNEDFMEVRMKGRDMKRIIKSVMRDTDKGIPVSEIAVRNDIDGELAELICRLYLTHPGVSADGIMGKMGL